MNNLKKTMLALSLLIPVNSAFGISFPSWEGFKAGITNLCNITSKKSVELCKHPAYYAAYYATIASLKAQAFISDHQSPVVVSGILATGLAATGIAYKKNTKFNKAVNDKFAPIKRFANNKLATIQNTYADLKEKYNVTDAQEAKAKKVAKYSALVGVAGLATYGICRNFFGNNNNK